MWRNRGKRRAVINTRGWDLINLSLINDILCVPESHSSLLVALRINTCPVEQVSNQQGWEKWLRDPQEEVISQMGSVFTGNNQTFLSFPRAKSETGRAQSHTGIFLVITWCNL